MATNQQPPADPAVDLRESLVEVVRGLDRALIKSAEAWQAALKELAATGRGISDEELKKALTGIDKIQEEFVATVSEIAGRAGERVQPELRGLVEQATSTGRESTRQTSALMSEVTRRFAGASADASLAGIELAGDLGMRFARLASGVLSGMADVLQKSGSGEKNK